MRYSALRAGLRAPSRPIITKSSPHERSEMRDHRKSANPDVAEFIIGRAFARPVGSSGLRLLVRGDRIKIAHRRSLVWPPRSKPLILERDDFWLNRFGRGLGSPLPGGERSICVANRVRGRLLYERP